MCDAKADDQLRCPIIISYGDKVNGLTGPKAINNLMGLLLVVLLTNVL